VGDDENRPQKVIPAAVQVMIVHTLGGRIRLFFCIVCIIQIRV